MVRERNLGCGLAIGLFHPGPTSMLTHLSTPCCLLVDCQRCTECAYQWSASLHWVCGLEPAAAFRQAWGVWVWAWAFTGFMEWLQSRVLDTARQECSCVCLLFNMQVDCRVCICASCWIRLGVVVPCSSEHFICLFGGWFFGVLGGRELMKQLLPVGWGTALLNAAAGESGVLSGGRCFRP